ncbi:MAG TPA: TolC family protein [Chitinophagaceae bacterium]|nr:TolC family protein [Chitinophagaceae bacterium]
MKKHIQYLIYICAFFAAPLAALKAQQPLTLHDAVTIAIKNSMSIDIGKNIVDIATIYNNYATAGGMPVINGTANETQQYVSASQKYTNSANDKSTHNVGSNGFSANITGSVLISNGQRVVTAKKRLGVIENQSKDQLTSRIQIVTINVMLRYYDIIRQESYAKVLQQSIEASRQKLAIVKTQQNAGLANNADLFQAQVDLNTQIQLLQAQQAVIAQDKTDLLYQLTLNTNPAGDSTVMIADTSIAIDNTLNLDNILNSVPSHPDILAAQEQVEINQYLEKEAGAQRYPSLTANTGFNYTRNQATSGLSPFSPILNLQHGPFVGLSLTVPIFNGGTYRRQQEVAGINVQNAMLQKDTLLNGYKSNVMKNWAVYTSSMQQLATAKENYETAQKLLDLVLQKFRLRQATIIDVITAQQSFENAANLLINVSFTGKVAEIQLKRYGNTLLY